MDASNTNTAYPKSAEAILLPIFAFLAILLLIVPFIWHWRLRNIGACSLILYINLANFFTFINAIIWPAENFDSWWNGAGLCDIEVKLRWPCVTGLACATLCITRNLANVLDVDRAEVMPTKASKRRKVAIDLAICFTIPVLQIALHYIIQVNRYNITVIGGCHESYDNSWPTIVIMYIWPPLFSLINCYYAVAVIYRLRKHRSNFSAVLASSGSGLTTARFIRLFVMSITLILFYTPVCIFFFYINLNIEWLPYDWNVIHDPSQWWIILPLPTLGIRTFDSWVSIAMAIFVLAYFGMGSDAVETYRKWLLKLGLGRLFPILKEPHRQQHRNRKRSWTSQLSIISRVKQYFDTSRKNSNATTLGTSTDQASTIRRPSAIPMDPNTPIKHDINDLNQNTPPQPIPSISTMSTMPRSNRKANISTGTNINLSSQGHQALKVDLKIHIWSASSQQSQNGDIAHENTCIGDGKVCINTNVNRAVSHDLEAGQSYQT